MDKSSLANLEAKVAKLEAQNLQEFQKQMLQSLYKLRELLIKSPTTAVPQAAGEDPKDLRIKQLETENGNLKYRIGHLVNNLAAHLEAKGE